MNQTRLESFAEVMINVTIGWFIGLATQFLAFPLFGIQASFSSQVGLSMIFTVVSVVRSYVIRRWFNAGIHRLAVDAARRFVK